MKNPVITRIFVILIAVTVVTGCIGPFQNESKKDIRALKEYPGVYLTNDVSALPLATSGYDLYVIGENPHGTREIHHLFVEYLKILHETCGLRDVILEANQHATEEANAYALGEIEEFPAQVWNRPCRFDVLESIRVINAGLPDTEKIRVHLVDIDVGITQQGYDNHTYTFVHLMELREELGADHIGIPPWEEFMKLDTDAMLELVETLEDETEDEAFLNELQTVRASIEFIYWRASFDLREKVIAQNILYVLKELDNAPVLALYGSYHICKVSDEFSAGDPWVKRVMDSGVSVYAVTATAMSGEYWLDYYHYQVTGREFWFEKILLDENTTLEALFDKWPQYNMVYIDFRTYTTAKIPWQASGHFQLSVEASLSDAYDGIILFKEVGPGRTS
ncbi:MAG: erythromycin esterase family protein [Candidatus Methanofastidiosia archaeon]|jgi:hypothetical protein